MSYDTIASQLKEAIKRSEDNQMYADEDNPHADGLREALEIIQAQPDDLILTEADVNSQIQMNDAAVDGAETHIIWLKALANTSKNNNMHEVAVDALKARDKMIELVDHITENC